MSLHPEIQRKAQEEIDRQVGMTRLPAMSDRPKLPYIEALLQEILRWHPIVPLSLPHMNDEDFIFKGYLIPKGSTLLPNVWRVNLLR